MNCPVAAKEPGLDTVLPVLKRKVAPDYPETLRQSEIEGWVVLKTTIDLDGHTGDITSVNCTATRRGEELSGTSSVEACVLMSGAAIEAVKQWRYTVATEGGESVCIFFTHRTTFQLKDSGSSNRNSR